MPQRKKRIDIDEDYFNVNSHNMYYLLGIITTDGSIIDNGARVSFGVSSKDRELLKHICKQLKYDKKHIKDKLEKRLNKYHPISRLRINSNKIAKSLEKFSIYPRKTGQEIFPNIPIEYLYDYVRGIFDGDGTIVVRKNGQLALGICCANRTFLEELNKQAFSNLGKIYKDKNHFDLMIYKQDFIKTLKNKMYDNNLFCLTRKKEKFR